MNARRDAPTVGRAATERATAARARIAAAQRRRRMVVVGAAVAAVLLVVGVLVVVRVVTGGDGPRSGQRARAASTSVQYRVTHVPAAVLDAVGKGTALPAVGTLSGPALTAGGRPELLYIGAEWCPFCAATRWSLAVALSRFGTLTGLGESASSPSDVDPNTPTLTFHGAGYTSSSIVFVGKEAQSNQVRNGAYAELDPLTNAERALYAKGHGLPYVNVGGRYLLRGAPYDPGLLAGMTHARIAAALSDPSSAVAKAVDGGANQITAAICAVTGDAPASVCTSAGVRAVTLPSAR